MKKTIGSLFFGLMVLIASFHQVKAQDGFFSDARTLANQQFTLGIQPIFYTQLNNDDFMLMVRGGYGLQPNLSFYGKLGLLRNETYFGGHFKYMLAGEPYDPVSFSIIAGAHSFGDLGLKLGGELSKQIGPFSLYSGLSFEPLFTDPEALKPLLLPIGIDVPVSNNANFLFEADLALNNDAEYYEALHFGFNIYF